MMRCSTRNTAGLWITQHDQPLNRERSMAWEDACKENFRRVNNFFAGWTTVVNSCCDCLFQGVFVGWLWKKRCCGQYCNLQIWGFTVFLLQGKILGTLWRRTLYCWLGLLVWVRLFTWTNNLMGVMSTVSARKTKTDPFHRLDLIFWLINQLGKQTIQWCILTSCVWSRDEQFPAFMCPWTCCLCSFATLDVSWCCKRFFALPRAFRNFLWNMDPPTQGTVGDVLEQIQLGTS